MSGRKCQGDGASQMCPQNNTFDSMFQHLHIKDEWNYVIFSMIDVIISAYRIHYHESMILEYHIFLNLKADWNDNTFCSRPGLCLSPLLHIQVTGLCIWFPGKWLPDTLWKTRKVAEQHFPLLQRCLQHPLSLSSLSLHGNNTTKEYL